MATLSSFFGQAQGSGTVSGVITDPRKIPFFHVISPVYYKYGDNHTWYGSHTNDFWYLRYNSADNLQPFDNYVDQFVDDNGTPTESSTFGPLGADWAQYDSATYAGEFITIMDHSNEAGILCYVNGFGAKDQTSTTADPVTSQIRITVDGTAYTFRTKLRSHAELSAPNLGYNHPCWGHWAHNASYITGSYNQTYTAGYIGANMDKTRPNNWINYDGWDSYGVYDTAGRGTIYIPNISYYLFGNLPTLRYENSIKVECAVDKWTDTVTNGSGSAGQTTHRYTHRAFAKRIKDADVLI